MSEISERIMCGDYVSKAECFEHSEEIERTMDAYPKAMAAMDEWNRQMAACRCDWDIDWNGNGVRTAHPECPVQHEEQ